MVLRAVRATSRYNRGDGYRMVQKVRVAVSLFDSRGVWVANGLLALTLEWCDHQK